MYAHTYVHRCTGRCLTSCQVARTIQNVAAIDITLVSYHARERNRREVNLAVLHASLSLFPKICALSTTKFTFTLFSLKRCRDTSRDSLLCLNSNIMIDQLCLPAVQKSKRFTSTVKKIHLYPLKISCIASFSYRSFYILL